MPPSRDIAMPGSLQAACRDLIETASSVASVEEVHALCCELCELGGFDYFIYGAEFPVSLVRPQTVIISGFPDDWRAHYEERAYIRVDPTVRHCIIRSTPLVWDEIAPLDEDEQAVIRNFMSEAADFGLRSGVSFPTHGQYGEAAMLSLVSNDPHPRANERILAILPFGQLMVGYVHEAVRRVFSGSDLMLGRAQLTDRERECLLWAAEGKTSEETALILGVANRTVIFHLQNAARKLDVTNRSQAVARAVAQGYIRPQFG